MATLQVDTEEFIMALENHSPEIRYFLDKQTGEFVLLGYEGVLGDEDFQETFEEEFERFEEIEPLPSSRGFDVMLEFAETVAPQEAKPSLLRALERRHPFRSFKDALFDFPEVRESWFRYKDQVYKGFVQEWLEDHDIEATLKPTFHERTEQEG